MPAVILDFMARFHAREAASARPFVPDDFTVYPDGDWACSTNTTLNLLAWFERYGYDFDPTCRYDDLVSDLSAIVRAAALLERIDALPAGSSYYVYLCAVKKGHFSETKAARERLPEAAWGTRP